MFPVCPDALGSVVISRPSSNNCALLISSLSPRSPVSAFDTLGASLIKKDVNGVVLNSTPVAAYENKKPLSESNPPSVINEEPQC